MNELVSTEIRVDWYLTRWKGFVMNRHELDERMQACATVFFRSLKRLDEKEVRFLGEKYYTDESSGVCMGSALVDRYKPRTDQQMAGALGVDKKSYTSKRVEITTKLRKIILEETQLFNQGVRKKLERYWLKCGKLYLKEYQEVGGIYLEPNFVFTQDNKQALIFNYGDQLAELLEIYLGLIKEPLSELSHYPMIQIKY